MLRKYPRVGAEAKKTSPQPDLAFFKAGLGVYYSDAPLIPGFTSREFENLSFNLHKIV